MLFYGCSESDNSKPYSPEPRLIIRFNFDINQKRLNNRGEPAVIPSGHAAQSPSISRMSAHYLEFTSNANTALGDGEILFEGTETLIGGSSAIDFQNAFFAGDDEVFLNVPMSLLSKGTYKWARVSLAYQEGDIQFRFENEDYTGRLASFVGYNNYIGSLDLNGRPTTIEANKPQGFWIFEAEGYTAQGQAPEGATTVPNPLYETSPIPQGSCLVTGRFEDPLLITGDETEDRTVTLSFSINNSFEWVEVNKDGKYEPSAGEQVVDMGLRGLIARASN